jgi:DNA-binding response OmpR family regulator
MPKASILVVDDDPGLRSLVATSLAMEGHEVMTAPDGSTALRVVEQNSPTLILLDKAMPLLSGPEFARELRARGFNTPIIVISGSEDGQQFAMDIQALSFISKPFQIPQLLGVVSEVLTEFPLDESHAG